MFIFYSNWSCSYASANILRLRKKTVQLYNLYINFNIGIIHEYSTKHSIKYSCQGQSLPVAAGCSEAQNGHLCAWMAIMFTQSKRWSFWHPCIHAPIYRLDPFHLNSTSSDIGIYISVGVLYIFSQMYNNLKALCRNNYSYENSFCSEYVY